MKQMQTFLPYEDFHASAKALDTRRLMKQRVECKQILIALTSGGAWSKHPATLMWKGSEFFLSQYALAVHNACAQRGVNDFKGIEAWFVDSATLWFRHGTKTPWWLGYEPFHASHRSNLLRKEPAHYKQFSWVEPDNLPYFWPTHKQHSEFVPYHERTYIQGGGT